MLWMMGGPFEIVPWGHSHSSTMSCSCLDNRCANRLEIGGVTGSIGGTWRPGVGGHVDMMLVLIRRRAREDAAVVTVDLPMEASDGQVNALEAGGGRRR